ncbi:MAG: hypothetical protein RLZZ69_3342 [Cyanobacteriota bacterium]
MKYLGAELIANPAVNHSTIQVGMYNAARQIIRRCQAIKALRRYRIKAKLFQQLCQSLFGGKLNYFTSWLGAEIKIPAVMNPLKRAYHEYMRTYVGAMKTTPIPLLYAMSRFPLLTDKIQLDTAITVVKAVALSNLLGDDFNNWTLAPEIFGKRWTPFRLARKALKQWIPASFGGILPEVMIEQETLEGLSGCIFHLDDRKSALEKYKKQKLIARTQCISLWTDGSLQPGDDHSCIAPQEQLPIYTGIFQKMRFILRNSLKTLCNL